MPSLKATRSRKANKKLDELKLGEANASQLKTDHESSGKRPSKSYSRTTGERIAKLQTPTIHQAIEARSDLHRPRNLVPPLRSVVSRHGDENVCRSRSRLQNS